MYFKFAGTKCVARKRCAPCDQACRVVFHFFFFVSRKIDQEWPRKFWSLLKEFPVSMNVRGCLEVCSKAVSQRSGPRAPSRQVRTSTNHVTTDVSLWRRYEMAQWEYLAIALLRATCFHCDVRASALTLPLFMQVPQTTISACIPTFLKFKRTLSLTERLARVCRKATFPVETCKFKCYSLLAGTFSHVYKARLRSDPTKEFAIKFLIPTSHPVRIANELKCLKDVG